MIMINNNLRVFISAAELGNLTETAKKLYVTQPAVSHAIKKLEEELDVRLFVRNKRNALTLTAAGQDILAMAYKMSDLENKIYQRAYEENHMINGTVRVATVPTGVSLIFSRVLPIFRKRYPGVQVDMLERNTLEVRNMVLNSQVDLGIGSSPYNELEYRLLMTDRMVSINRDESVSIDLNQDSSGLILCRGVHEFIGERLAGQSIDLSHCIVTEAASTQINLVSEGNGTGIISELMLAAIPNELVRGSVTPNMEIEISLIAREFQELTPAAHEMAKMILERFEEK